MRARARACACIARTRAHANVPRRPGLRRSWSGRTARARRFGRPWKPGPARTPGTLARAHARSLARSLARLLACARKHTNTRHRTSTKQAVRTAERAVCGFVGMPALAFVCEFDMPCARVGARVRDCAPSVCRSLALSA